ncbi:MAG: selenocysteine-specific translation elongation factor [Tissierellia bacterium]|nr:selenocysteine-specific translation elongation factor [Tissierellia bacterium]
MKNIIIGTAGHIDHGKTTLIKALTGHETDRLSEERKRGITIDLGFTYFDLPDGNKAGIIDVPGHEKFVKNMLAGVVGMDLVLLVIAADEGIMPQTDEHINILNMLGIKKGIVVLTKYDLVEEEWLELVKEDLKEDLRDTFLENAPVISVSSITKYGINELVEAIVNISQEDVEERDINTIPRLPIDRVFSITGFGTVITGTLISGKLKKGDEVEIYPVNKISKLRNIQVHNLDAEYAYAGQRTAINLSNIKKTDIYRGCVIAPVNSMKNTLMLDVKLNLLKSSRRIVENRSRLHLYTGTSEILCRVVLLDRDELSPGESCYAQLRLEEEIAVRRGDKFIVRFYSPMETIGGGEIIEPVPLKRKRFDENLIEELMVKEKGSNTDVIEKIIKQNSNSFPSIGELAKLTALTVEELSNNIEILEQEEKISVIRQKNENYVFHKSYEREFKDNIEKYLYKFHNENMYKKGVKKSEIKSKFFPKIKQSIFDSLIQDMFDKNVIKKQDEYISLTFFKIDYDDNYLKIESSIIKLAQEAKYNFVKIEEIKSKFIKNSNIDDIIALLIDDNKLIKLNDEFVISKKDYDEALNLLISFIKTNDKITAGEFRDLLDTNRKNAIIFLEYFDILKVTKRIGNDRVLF